MNDLSRRGFVGAAGALAAGASAHAAGRVAGANETIRVGFIGVGNLWSQGGDRVPEGRCQAHIGHVLKMTGQKKPVQAVAVCDVFNRYRDDAAARIDKANKEAGVGTPCKKYADYRELLADKDIDAVCIATPDHWHARMTIDACKAGKDVYCEKPMTHTVDESYQVVDAVNANNRIMQVGVQSTANPIWAHAYGQIKEGRIGKVVHAQTHYYRNSMEGQWRYYALKSEMTPKNIDWKMFLGTDFGLAPETPFDRARFAQWRCYWDYGGGMFTDLFVHRITRIMKTTGLRAPKRVVGAGGIYLEYDGRDVPDVSTIVADFEEGCQVMVTACMTNDFNIDECVRGHLGTIVLDEGKGYEIFDQQINGGPKASFESFRPASGTGQVVTPDGVAKGDMTYQHWENFLECVRTRNKDALNNPCELGAAAITLVNMGVRSYREGKAFFFDHEAKKVVAADPSWATGWEKRSHDRGEPTQVPGWRAGIKGSKLEPKPYQKLAGAWIDGKDPSGA